MFRNLSSYILKYLDVREMRKDWQRRLNEARPLTSVVSNFAEISSNNGTEN